jgi:hypothetical protein
VVVAAAEAARCCILKFLSGAAVVAAAEAAISPELAAAGTPADILAGMKMVAVVASAAISPDLATAERAEPAGHSDSLEALAQDHIITSNSASTTAEAVGRLERLLTATVT